jgi:hypothetical protein
LEHNNCNGAAASETDSNYMRYYVIGETVVNRTWFDTFDGAVAHAKGLLRNHASDSHTRGKRAPAMMVVKSLARLSIEDNSIPPITVQLLI